MPTLCLLRHASARHAADDFARTLTPRGQNEAAAVGRRLAASGWVPERVLCSSAARARQTWELARAAGGAPFHAASVAHEQRLYLASPERLSTCLAEVDAACERVLLIAHNPGLFDMLDALLHRAADRERLRRGLPPAACAVIATEDPWTHLGTRPCQLVAFYPPEG